MAHETLEMIPTTAWQVDKYKIRHAQNACVMRPDDGLMMMMTQMYTSAPSRGDSNFLLQDDLDKIIQKKKAKLRTSDQ